MSDNYNSKTSSTSVESSAEEYAIEVRDLVVHYETQSEVVEAVNGVSLQIKKGETFGLVGETGAGKTTIALSMMGLLPVPPSNVIRGGIFLNGEDLFMKTKKEMQGIRGKHISMVFQDPMTALDPVQRVGNQIMEAIKHHQRLPKARAAAKASEMLQLVGIPPGRYHDYPHQFSGGMKQRVVIAIALACEPGFIIADEPTTALDVTIQAQVMDLIKDLRMKFNTSMLLITHDFGVVAEICDKCAVIYAGRIVESGTVEHIFENPQHPYTKGLFDSIPILDEDVDRLNPIPGLMINPADLPEHCSFYERCMLRRDSCMEVRDPGLQEYEPGHFVACYQVGKGEDRN